MERAHTFAHTHTERHCLGLSQSVNWARRGSLSQCLSISWQTPLRLVFFFFPSRPFYLDLSSCFCLHSATQFAGVFDDFIYPSFQVSSQQEPPRFMPRFASLQVAINHAVWSRNGAPLADSAQQAVSGLDRLRQATRERHSRQALGAPRNATGLIRALSIKYGAKLILTFKPGWWPTASVS